VETAEAISADHQDERAKPINVKRQIIRQRGYVHWELEHEDVAEFAYRPTACHRG